MKTFIISAIAAGLALSSAAAVAQTTGAEARPQGGKEMGPMTKEQHRQKGEEMFRKWDTDGNGTVTKQEFQTAHDAKFTQMDTNNDGTVSPDEHRAHKAHKKADKR